MKQKFTGIEEELERIFPFTQGDILTVDIYNDAIRSKVLKVVDNLVKMCKISFILHL